MKISRQLLKRIIREEYDRLLESPWDNKRTAQKIMLEWEKRLQNDPNWGESIIDIQHKQPYSDGRDTQYSMKVTFDMGDEQGGGVEGYHYQPPENWTDEGWQEEWDMFIQDHGGTPEMVGQVEQYSPTNQPFYYIFSVFVEE